MGDSGAGFPVNVIISLIGGLVVFVRETTALTGLGVLFSVYQSHNSRIIMGICIHVLILGLLVLSLESNESLERIRFLKSAKVRTRTVTLCYGTPLTP